ncbi:MAG: AAA family ATPase [Saprospiraceae bacterium]|jgi:MoxR-like ATPase
MTTTNEDVKSIKELTQNYISLKEEISKVIIGQETAVKMVLMAILGNGHSLLLGVPGLAKTLLISTIAEVMEMEFKRIQFTPDLMPSDIIGSELLNRDRDFIYNKGPIFSNIVLADEINRTPPKTQAALLEAMQEKSVTVSGIKYQLPKPFFVLATQNPIEQEGTYPLPEAQLDRFMFTIPLDYPSYEEEIKVVTATTGNAVPTLNKIIDKQKILDYQNLIRKIPITENVVKYAVSLVAKTRPGQPGAPNNINQYISWGAGPRASQYLALGAKCHAALNGKFSPDIEDVQKIAPFVLRHRIVRNFRAEAEGITENDIIETLL